MNPTGVTWLPQTVTIRPRDQSTSDFRTTASRREEPHWGSPHSHLLPELDAGTSHRMCKTQGITYKCGHMVNFRLSKCAASFKLSNRRGEAKAMCFASPDMILHLFQQCGPCQREIAQQEIAMELAAVEAKSPKSNWIVPEEVEKAQIEADEMLWARFQGLPNSQFKSKKLPNPGRGWASTAHPKRSLLRIEVKPEDVIEVRGGWRSLSDEIAKIEAERAAEGIPPLAPIIPMLDEDWSDVAELGACRNDSAQGQKLCDVLADVSEAPELQVAQEEKSTTEPAFVPPHLRYRQPVGEKARKVMQNTTSANRKRKSMETTRVVRYCAAPA